MAALRLASADEQHAGETLKVNVGVVTSHYPNAKMALPDIEDKAHQRLRAFGYGIAKMRAGIGWLRSPAEVGQR